MHYFLNILPNLNPLYFLSSINTALKNNTIHLRYKLCTRSAFRVSKHIFCSTQTKSNSHSPTLIRNVKIV